MDTKTIAVEPSRLTPLMQQYHTLKARFPQEILLFRLGDFYEMFDADAKRAAPILEVALTHRQQVPMCGVPHHAIDSYIARLLKAGLRVAIADQLEEPTPGKGIVKRDVVRVMTPGTLQEETLLPSKRCNFLVALSTDAQGTGLAAIECSTGEFVATEISQSASASGIWDELMRLNPSEVVFGPSAEGAVLKDRLQKQGIAVADLPAIDFSAPIVEDRLKRLFDTGSLRGFGLEGKPRATAAAGAAVRYLESTQCGRPLTIQPLRTYALDAYLQMDASTLDHLDLVGDAGTPGRPRTLLDVLDQTLTPMGGRLLRRWLVSPLRQVEAIQKRQNQVEFFVSAKEARRSLRTILQGWPDMERILTRLSSGSLLPRDLAHLSNGLHRIPKLKTSLAEGFPDEPVLAALLEKALVETPPVTLKDGGVIRPGYDTELDEVRSWIHDGKTRLLELEKREREQTGIGSLKVSFNNVFGYYLEITKTHLARVPAHYTRKQTTANGERFITPELKEFETRILGAEERALRLETALVQALREEILKKTEALRRISLAVAELDVFLCLAEVAQRQNYVKPKIDDSQLLVIREGRHPVLEEVLPSGTLIPNDTDLDGKDKQIVILTGPNMSGKSTYLRQTALIAVMAQMGSFVPAAEAHIGVLDQLFTRIGASDRLTEGESTFMVEMVETARILNHATDRSLVILDEVGRGTSTYDGISIAWACLEYLHGSLARRQRQVGEGGGEGTDVNVKGIVPSSQPSPGARPGEGARVARGPKVLFATHYFELTRLAKELPGVRNAHVTAREWEDSVVFLHKVEDGPADRAYGIHVARLAGVPRSVLERAKALLQTFEQKAPKNSQDTELELPLRYPAPPAPGPGDALMEELAELDINSLTPVQALLKLQELKSKADL